jgi:hypothetical protein
MATWFDDTLFDWLDDDIGGSFVLLPLNSIIDLITSMDPTESLGMVIPRLRRSLPSLATAGYLCISLRKYSTSLIQNFSEGFSNEAIPVLVSIVPRAEWRVTMSGS